MDFYYENRYSVGLFQKQAYTGKVIQINNNSSKVGTKIVPKVLLLAFKKNNHIMYAIKVEGMVSNLHWWEEDQANDRAMQQL